MDATIRELRPEDVGACASILSGLPEWFGIPESNRAYVEALSHLPAAVAEREGHVVGFISLRSHDDRSAEIDAMAITPGLQHRGLGRSLVQWALDWCQSRGVVWLHVKTRGPSTPDPHYERTREFYRAAGFEPLFESMELWGPENAALILVRKVGLPRLAAESFGLRSAIVEREGVCSCGHLRYTVTGELAPVFNCHCRFCRRIHGAAFTTVGFLSAGQFSWHASSGKPSRYETPAGNHRYFCGQCSTPIYNHAPSTGLGCIVVASLAEDAQPAPWAHVNTESRSSNFEISDGLPTFPAWPDPSRLVELARLHDAVLPPELLGSTV